MRHEPADRPARSGGREPEARGRVQLFELGAVYLPKPGDQAARRAAAAGARAVAAGARPRRGTTRRAARAGARLLRPEGRGRAPGGGLHLPACPFRPTADVPFLHPGRAAELLVDGKAVGCVRRTAPEGGERVRAWPSGRCWSADLDLEAILAAVPDAVRVHAGPGVPRGPARHRRRRGRGGADEAVVAEIRAAGGELLAGVRLFDVYRGESIPAGTKSLAYALTYQAGPDAQGHGDRPGPQARRGATAARAEGGHSGEGVSGHGARQSPARSGGGPGGFRRARRSGVSGHPGRRGRRRASP